MTTLYLISLVLIGAVADGLNFRGRKTFGHSLRYIELPGLIALPLIAGVETWGEYGLLILSYALIRFALFSYVWNLCAGQPLTYIGVVDPVDKLMRLFKAPAHGWLFARIVFLVTGIAIAIKEL